MSDTDSQEENEEDWMSTKYGDPTESTFIPSPAKSAGPNTAIPKERIPHADPPKASTTGSNVLMNRMKLNDNKAGMGGLDKEKINEIILEASKGSKFYENERKKEEQMNRKIEEQKLKINQITDDDLKHGEMEADKLLEQYEKSRDLSRTILHIDMDAFYAAVEMRDKPSLKNKPMAVGGMSMLSTSNYHARKFGVRAAMPGFIGKKLCPELIIVPLNFDKYTDISKQVREILAEYDPNFSPMSLDEAYLDLTEYLTKRPELTNYERTVVCRKSDGCSSNLCNCDLNLLLKHKVLQHLTKTVTKILDTDLSDGCPMCGRPYPEFYSVTFGMSVEDTVHEIRSKIEQKTSLTASAGIAPNTMLAKVCSDMNKPNGQYRIKPTREDVMKFIKGLTTRKISGIGKVSETMLNAMNVYTCDDLYNHRGMLFHLYSSITFSYFMRIALGIGSTFVERSGQRKSMSTERTFNVISKPSDLYEKCEELCEALSEDLQEEKLKGKTVSIKIKTDEFEVKTRAQSIPDHTWDSNVIFATAKDLLRTELQAVAPKPLKLRLMGVRMSSLLEEKLCKKKQNTLKDFMNSKRNNKTKFIKPECMSENPQELFSEDIRHLDNRVMETCDKDDNEIDSLDKGKSLVVDDFKNKDCEIETKESSNGKVEGEEKCIKDFIREGCSNSENLENSSENCSHAGISTNCEQNTCSETNDVIKNVLDPGEVNQEVTTDETESYTCPICNDCIKCRDLASFNQHIDICLNKKIVKDCSRESNLNLDQKGRKVVQEKKKENRKTVKTKNKTMKFSSPIMKSKPKQTELKQQVSECKLNLVAKAVDENDVQIVADADKGEVSNYKLDYSSTKNPDINAISEATCQQSVAETLVCPVCFMEQNGKDLNSFNEHVDMCLSKDAIKQIVTHENRNAQKRILEASPKESVKKRKLNNNTRTIDAFFKT